MSRKTLLEEASLALDIVDTMREPILLLDPDLRVRNANRAFYQTFKVTPEDTEGRLLDELGDGQWADPSLREQLEQVIPNDCSFNDLELDLTFPGLGRRILLLNGRKLRGNGRGELLLLAMEDLTTRRGSERGVKAIEAYAQDIVDTVRKPLLILDTDLRVRSANQAFYNTFRVTQEETEGRLIYELGNGQWDIPGLRVLLEDIIPASSVFNDYELEHDFPAIGRRIMLLNARKLKAGHHRELLVLALEDVTERRRDEAEVTAAREQSENANRTKSLFLANMSHELRTPLNAILGYSEMLQEEAEELELTTFVADLQKINTSGKHLLALINDVLDLSKIEAGKMELFLERFSVASLVDEVASTLQSMVDANQNVLHVVIDPSLGRMFADQMKVRQGLYNLLSNAAKFTRAGSITIEAGRQILNGREWIVFRVADTGIGLSAEQILKLFQDFGQADASTTRRFGGTGLGLALTRRFCQMMGGDVTVESIEGEGSVFTIKLPAVVSESQEPAVGRSSDRSAGVSQGRRAGDGDRRVQPENGCVLVIDDDPIQRQLMENYLTREGFRTCAAAGGEEGVLMAHDMNPVAITLDVMMPGMDGWSVLNALKDDVTLRDIPVIMLTMADDPERGFTLGAADYASKPVDRQRLSRILKKYGPGEPERPVLLVEDDRATRAMMRNILEREGRQVQEAENGRVALEIMEETPPSLILLDLMMPEMDGFEFADEVRQHPTWRSIPIVVVTAHDVSGEERRRLNGYVESVLQKNGDAREVLLKRVGELLDDCGAPRKVRAAADPEIEAPGVSR